MSDPTLIERLRGSRPSISPSAKTLYEKAADEIERLRTAMQRTIDENRGFADGDNCTLIHIKRALED